MRGRATRARGAKGLTIGLRETQAAPRAHLRCARRAIAGVDGGIDDVIVVDEVYDEE